MSVLMIGSGLGDFYVRSVSFSLPCAMTFQDFAAALEERGDVKVEYRQNPLSFVGGEMQYSYTFRVKPKKTSHTKREKFWFWKLTITKNVYAEVPYLAFDFGGHFGNGLQESINVGCAYDYDCDSLASSWTFKDDPDRMKSFLAWLYEQLSKGVKAKGAENVR